VPFTITNLKRDVEDIGRQFDGAQDLEFRAAGAALELEHSALGYQLVPRVTAFRTDTRTGSRKRCTSSCAGADG
jgi:hypothetical protein